MSELSASDALEYLKSMRASVVRYPNCLIANCDCNSKKGEWHKGCHCLCHFKAMDAMYGEDNWTLAEFGRQAEKGRRDDEAADEIEGGQDADTNSE